MSLKCQKRQFSKREVPCCVMQLEQKGLVTPSPEVNPFIIEFDTSTMKSFHDLQTLNLLETGMCFGKVRAKADYYMLPDNKPI